MAVFKKLISGKFNKLEAWGEDYFKAESRKIIIAPVQIIAALTVIAGIYALLFEVEYYEEFQFGIYWGRLIATTIGFLIFAFTFFEKGRKHPELYVHILLISIILSFASIIIIIPETLFVNSQILSLVIFTSALFLSWDIKNQIIVAIYYNLLFAFSIFLSQHSVFFLPNLFGTVIFIIFVSIMSVFANAINFNLRKRAIRKTLEAKDIFENSSEGLFRLSSTGDLIAYNKAFKKILRLASDYKIKNLSEVFHNIEEFNEILKVAEKNGGRYKLDFRDKNGDEFYVEMAFRSYFDSSNELLYFDGNLSDNTSQILAEKKIKHYTEELEELNSSKDKFFSVVSHDLKSPFTALLGYSEYLTMESETLERGEIKSFANNINKVAKSTFHLLDNLLNWSRIQTNRMTCNPVNFNLNEIAAEEILNLQHFAESKQIKIVNSIDNSIEIFADVDMVKIVLNNLITNAINFNKENGQVEINAGTINGNVQVNVSDEGIGISPKDIDKLFKIGIHKTEVGNSPAKGSGLGLILSQAVAEKNGGSISVESVPGSGSTFSLTIPSAK